MTSKIQSKRRGTPLKVSNHNGFPLYYSDTKFYRKDIDGSLRCCMPNGQAIPRIRRSKKERLRLKAEMKAANIQKIS